MDPAEFRACAQDIFKEVDEHDNVVEVAESIRDECNLPLTVSCVYVSVKYLKATNILFTSRKSTISLNWTFPVTCNLDHWDFSLKTWAQNLKQKKRAKSVKLACLFLVW